MKEVELKGRIDSILLCRASQEVRELSVSQ